MDLYFNYLSYLLNIIALGTLFYKIYIYLNGKRIIKLFFGSDTEISIYIPLREWEKRNKSVVTSEDIIAALKLIKFFEENKVKVELKYLSYDTEISLDDVAIIMCGPKSSSKIGHLYQEDPIFRFQSSDQLDQLDQLDHWIIKDMRSGSEHISPIDKDSSDQRDIAYVSQRKNAGKNITLIAGIHAAGSTGASQYLTNLKNLKHILKQSGNSSKNTSFLVSSKYSGDPLQILSSEIITDIKTHN